MTLYMYSRANGSDYQKALGENRCQGISRPREAKIGSIGFAWRTTRHREIAGWRYLACMCVRVDKIRM